MNVKRKKVEDAGKVEKNVLKTPDGKPFKVQHSWKTDDAYEIELRQVRAASEEMVVNPVPSPSSLFRDYEIVSKNANYMVELRSLSKRINTCTCKDFQKNHLGTCKHIEFLLQRIGAKKGMSPFYEIYLDRFIYQPVLMRPQKTVLSAANILNVYFADNGQLRTGVEIPKMLSAIDSLPETLRSVIRIS